MRALEEMPKTSTLLYQAGTALTQLFRLPASPARAKSTRYPTQAGALCSRGTGYNAIFFVFFFAFHILFPVVDGILPYHDGILPEY